MAHLDDCKFVVTGATGWLGRACLGVLEARLGERFSARVFAYASKDGETGLRPGRTVRYRALDQISELPAGRHVFLHCAFLGKERVAGLALADYVALNEEISEKVCDAARGVGVAGFFVPSSGAVYGKDQILETDIEKNSYGVMKRKDEERFTRLAADLNCPAVVARVFNVAGPYINKIQSYALGSILEDILLRRPVRIRANQRIIRSYVHVSDLIALVLAALDEGAAAPVCFDTAGEREVEVGELARLAMAVLGAAEGVIERPPLDPSLPDNRYVGDGAVMMALAQRYNIALRPLPVQIADTAYYLSAMQGRG
jgi:UDP-glucuronate decarboxylase